jgi:surface antigen
LAFLLTSIKALLQLAAAGSRPSILCGAGSMSTPIRVIVLCAALAAWLPAQAQLLGPGLRTNIALTKQDLAMIRHTADEEVHGRAVGTRATWSNPQSGNSGEITLVAKFTQNGQRCETLDYRLTTSRRATAPEHYVLRSCLQPDGQWRLI